jgi:hypothetical protein
MFVSPSLSKTLECCFSFDHRHDLDTIFLTGPYFPIRLDRTNPTGVFVPNQIVFPKKGEKVDVILFFHGSKVGKFSDFPNINIDYYWSNNDEYGKATLK